MLSFFRQKRNTKKSAGQQYTSTEDHFIVVFAISIVFFSTFNVVMDNVSVGNLVGNSKLKNISKLIYDLCVEIIGKNIAIFDL